MGNSKFRTIRTVAALGTTLWCTTASAQSDDESGDASSTSSTSSTSTTPSTPSTPSDTVGSTPTTTTTSLMSPWGSSLEPLEPSEGGSYGFEMSGPGQTATVRGNPEGSFVLTSRPTGVPMYHTVRRGDTLWDLCDRYYDNPYAWPRVWSYNPQVENPHWIYPGDRLRMRASGVAGDHPTDQSGVFVRKQSFVPNGTVFLRDYGFIGDDSEGAWGTLIGSPDDQLLLSAGNDAYVKIDKDHDVRVGQEYALFKNTRKPEAGERNGSIVQIKGTVKVTQWHSKTRVARVRIVESLDVIERGDRVGPVSRRFDIVPPVRNEREVWAKITGEIQPRELLGQHQVVFIDKGEHDGLRPGNRLFVVASGDRWGKSVKHGRKTVASTVHYELHTAEVTAIPDAVSQDELPSEVVGEVRVLRTRKDTAICIVTNALFELEPGQTVLARRGY